MIDGPWRCYRFDGNSTLEFARNQVINHRLQVTRPFSAGESVEGFLLGIGCDPIPAEFYSGKNDPAFLVLYDQFGRPYRLPLSFGPIEPRKIFVVRPHEYRDVVDC